MLADGFLEARLYRVWPGNAIGVRALEPIAKDQWQHVTVTYDGSSRAAGCGSTLTARRCRPRSCATTSTSRRSEASTARAQLTLGGRFRDRGFKGGEIDELRLFDRALTPLEIEDLHDGQALRNRTRGPCRQSRCAARRITSAAVDRRFARHAMHCAAARQKLVEAENAIQEVAVMRELPSRGRRTSCRAARTMRRRRTTIASSATRSRTSSTPLPGRRAARSAGAGPVAHRSGASAHGARVRQSPVGEFLRPRAGGDAGEFWPAGRGADASGVARLAGPRLRRPRLGRQAAVPTDRALGDVSAGFAVAAGTARARSRESAARPRAEPAAVGGADSRPGTGGVGPARIERSAARRFRRISRARICGANRTPCRPRISNRPARRCTAARCTRCGSGPRRCRT